MKDAQIPQGCYRVSPDGKLPPEGQKALDRDIALNAGRVIFWNVKRLQKETSPEARGYYFGVVVVYWMKEYGTDDPDFMHEILKVLYNFKPVLVGDEVVRVPLSTSKKAMQSDGFSKYVDRCCNGFVEHYNGNIPPASSAISLRMIEEYNQLGNARNK